MYNLQKMFTLLSIPLTDKYYWIAVWVVLSLIGFLFLVEIFLKLNDTPYDNVNRIIRKWASHQFYFVTFLAGVVSGHLFLGSTVNWVDCDKLGIKLDCDTFNILVVAALCTILLITGLFTQKERTKDRTQYILYAVGLMVGHFGWSLNIYV